MLLLCIRRSVVVDPDVEMGSAQLARETKDQTSSLGHRLDSRRMTKGPLHLEWKQCTYLVPRWRFQDQGAGLGPLQLRQGKRLQVVDMTGMALGDPDEPFVPLVSAILAESMGDEQSSMMPLLSVELRPLI